MKRKFLITILTVLCTAACVSGLAACDSVETPPTHTHDYQWVDNGDGTHKQHCANDGCDAADVSVGKHDFTNGNCVCGKEKPAEGHAHAWAQIWEKSETHHWHNCTVEGCTVTDNSQKDGYAEHDFTNGNCVCGKEKPVESHTHTYSDEWSYDEDYHWHAATCGHTDETKDRAAHEFTDGKCTGCGKRIGEGLQFERVGEDLKVIGYKGSDAKLIIPSVWQDDDTGAFKNVVAIEKEALRYCTSLTEITVPDSVTSIGFNSMPYSAKIAKITLPFVGATLNGTENTHFGYIFGAKSEVNHGSTVPRSLKEVVITGGESIAAKAFYKCSTLSSVTIQDTVTSIGKGVFEWCSGLTSLSLPFVGAQADGTENVHLGYMFKGSTYGKVTTAYEDNTTLVPESLTKIAITGNVKIGTDALRGCGKITEITLSDSVVSVASKALSGTNISYAKVPAHLWRSIPKEKLSTLVITEGLYGIIDADTSVCPVLTDLTICDGVTLIRNSAFAGFTALTNVSIAADVKDIQTDAFKNCENLSKVNISDIGSWCNINFGNKEANPLNCAGGLYLNGEKLTALEIPAEVTEIEDYAFCGYTDLSSVTIPSQTKRIKVFAFSGCSGLENVYYAGDIAGWCRISGLDYIMSANRTLHINGKAVAGELEIPNGVTSVESYAFAYCNELTSVVIPDSVTYIGSHAFAGCNGLEKITVPFVGGMSEWEDGMPEESSFTHFGWIFGAIAAISESDPSGNKIVYGNLDCVPESLKEVVITGSERIDENAFYNCVNIEKITLPDSINKIGKSAFFRCPKLTGVYITDLAAWCKIVFGDLNANPLQCSHSLYLNDTKITDLILPDSVTKINSYAFYSCTSLTSVSLSDHVTEIGYMAFGGCSSLTGITVSSGNNNYHSEGNCLIDTAAKKLIVGCKTSIIPTDGSVTVIGNSAFYNCTGLQSIVIPECVTDIEDYAFNGCSSLTSVKIPDKVTKIGRNVFSNCSSLASVEIPNGVTSIGIYAFVECRQLTNIKFNGTKEQWNAITKDISWNYTTGNYVVHCEDGDIVKS